MPFKFKRTGPAPGRRDLTLQAVVLEGFLARLGFSMVTFALPFYALSLGMSLTQVGLLAALRAIVALAIKPLVGIAADRFGTKAVYAWSIAVRCLVGFLFVAATVPWALFSIRALHGVATAARGPTSAMLIVDGARDTHIARTFSWYATAKVLGGALGYPLAGILLTLTNNNYHLVFACAAATSLVSWFAVSSFVRLAPAQPGPALNAAEGASLHASSEAGVAARWLEFAGLAVIVALPASMIKGLFPVIASQWSGLNKAEIGTVYAASMGLVVIAGPLLGWVADRFSLGLVLSLRSCANLLSSVLFLFMPGFWGLAGGRFADDVGKAGFRPAWGAIMSEVTRSGNRRRRGRVLSYLDTAESLGEAIGPVLAGVLWDHGGIQLMLAARIGLSLAAELYTMVLLRNRSRRSQPPVPVADIAALKT